MRKTTTTDRLSRRASPAEVNDRMNLTQVFWVRAAEEPPVFARTPSSGWAT
jgi:hypothetical protein